MACIGQLILVYHPPPPFTLIRNQEPEWEVEKIVDHRPKHACPLRLRQFRVRYLGHNPDEDAWLPYSYLNNCPDLLAEYGMPVPQAGSQASVAQPQVVPDAAESVPGPMGRRKPAHDTPKRKHGRPTKGATYATTTLSALLHVQWH